MRKNQSELGISLIETVVALALLGFVAVIFLSSLSATAKGNFISDQAGTAASLALFETEAIKVADYVPGATQYDPAPLPVNGDYTGYSVMVGAQSLHTPDDGIQKIMVDIYRSGKLVYSLQSYKAER